MAYTSFESAAGEAQDGVEALCRHLTNAGDFDASTTPLLDEVERYLTISYAWVVGILAKAGLSATQTDAEVVAILEQLNVYDTCVKIELGQPAQNATGEPSLRFVAFTERRDELLEMVTDGTLSAMGADTDSTASSRRTPVLTGQFHSRKRVAETNSDRTQHRIRRGVFERSDLVIPTAESERQP